MVSPGGLDADIAEHNAVEQSKVHPAYPDLGPEQSGQLFRGCAGYVGAGRVEGESHIENHREGQGHHHGSHEKGSQYAEKVAHRSATLC